MTTTQGKRSCIRRPPSAKAEQKHPVSIVDTRRVAFSTLDIRGQVVYMVPHGAQFAVSVKNPFPHDKCSFRLEIDGLTMGSWVLKPGASGYFERPTKVAQCFTFYSTPLVSRAEDAADKVSNNFNSIYDPEVQKDLLSAPLGTGINEDNSANGIVKCTFTPEAKEVQSLPMKEDKPMRSRGTFSKPNSPGPRSGSDAAASTPTSSRNNISAEFRRRASDFRPKEEHPSSHVARPSSAPSNARASYSAEQKSDISVLSKKKKCSMSSRCRGGLLTTSLLGASPPSLTAGASTLQGHSSQKFGKTSLEKDVSRAVSFIVRMVAAVPPPPSFPDMTGMPMNPMATGIVCHSHPRFAGGSTQSLPVPLSTAQRSSAAQSLQAV